MVELEEDEKFNENFFQAAEVTWNPKPVNSILAIQKYLYYSFIVNINNLVLNDNLGDGISFPQRNMDEDQEGLLHEHPFDEEELRYP
ncbi:hypothetical protein YQE_09255, partial [Dendroctonus ponderosae]